MNIITAENLVALGVVLSVLSTPLLYCRSGIVKGGVCAVWAATGSWCGYLLYCLFQIPDMTGYHMFG